MVIRVVGTDGAHSSGHCRPPSSQGQLLTWAGVASTAQVFLGCQGAELTELMGLP